MPENKVARKECEVFKELEDLCHSPGYVHVIAYLCFRDNTIRYAVFFKIVVTVYMLSRLLHWQLFFRVQCRRTNRLAVPDGPCAPA